MLSLLSARTEEIHRFRVTPWLYQQTFKTPLKDLNRFVSTFLAPFSLESAALSTDEVVFEPKHLLHLLANNSLSVENYYHLTIQALTGKRKSPICLKLRWAIRQILFSFHPTRPSPYTPTTTDTPRFTLRMMRH